MAGEDLFASLYSSKYAPVDTTWGIAAQGVAGALPLLVNPYASTGANFASVLGGALVSGLLGYQARQVSDERNVLQSKLLSEALQPGVSLERRQAIMGEDPRLAKVISSIDLTSALARIKAQETQAQEEAKAKVETQKQIDIERGVPYGTTKASEVGVVPSTTTGGMSYLGKAGETELKDIQKTFSNRPEFKNYSYTSDVVKRLAQGVMKTDAVSDVDFAKGAIQAIEPGLATQQGEVNAITQSPSIPDQLKASMANAAEGKGKLTPKIRAQILGIAENAYNTQADKYNQQLEFYTQEAVTRTRRPELKDEIAKRVSDLGRAKPYEEVVNQWFKVPGQDLGDLDAAKVIRAIATEQLTPEQLISALQQRKEKGPAPGPTAAAAARATGPSTVAPIPEAQAEVRPVIVSPTATPEARVMSPVAAALAPSMSQTPVAVVAPVAPVKAPSADALDTATQKAVAAQELRALDQKGINNWTVEDRVKALQLRSILRG